MDRLLKRIAPAAKVDSTGAAAPQNTATADSARWTVLEGVCDSALQCGELWKIPPAAESDSAALGETTPVLNRAAGPLDSDQNPDWQLQLDSPVESDSALEALVQEMLESGSEWTPVSAVRWAAEQCSAELTREYGEQLAANWWVAVDLGDSSGE